jgi:glycosyltransferase involved in cell wall biosynthesis
VGRHIEPKHPLDALNIFSRVNKVIPTATLTFIGGDNKSVKSLKKKLSPELLKNIQFITESKDIASYYSNASVHLLTSITESFCLVLAEAKAYAIPTVMYEIPFLELAMDTKRHIEVERWDRQAAADKIIDLLNNQEKRIKLGEEAKQSVKIFNNSNVLMSWKALFTAVINPKLENKEKDLNQIILRELYLAWEYNRKKNSWKINFFDTLEKYTRLKWEKPARFISEKLFFYLHSTLKRNK